MLVLAVNWTTTISSLATGFGTLVLAIATFASVRSSNRSARISELALQEQRRPILTQSRLDDPVQKIMFVEQHWVHARGGHGVAEHDGSIYFALSLRNVGSGIGVCQGWSVSVRETGRVARDHTPEDEFRLQTRDLYVPAGDIGMWQGALRDRNDPTYQAMAEAIDNREMISLELLYSDQVGAQRTISRFGLIPYETENGVVEWFGAINRHWYLDRAGPRTDEQVAAAAEVVFREREASEQAVREEAELEAGLEAEVRAEGEAEEAAGVADAGDGAGDAYGDGAAGARVVQRDREPVSATVIPRPNCE